jgi:L-methionine (R)-S-oxide reductase
MWRRDFGSGGLTIPKPEITITMADSALFEEILILLRKDMARPDKAKAIAEAIRADGSYRWTGLYDVDMRNGMVKNIGWSGPAGPQYPTFPVTKGLTSRAIASKTTVNVGNVAADPDYLTASPTTRSEIVIPIAAGSDRRIIGTLDVESALPDAFDSHIQTRLEQCASLLAAFWADGES